MIDILRKIIEERIVKFNLNDVNGNLQGFYHSISKVKITAQGFNNWTNKKWEKYLINELLYE
jgi:hypothetical protein